jgi:hypothetical protein
MSDTHVSFAPMDPAAALDLGLRVGILPDIAETGTVYRIGDDGVEQLSSVVVLLGDPVEVELGMWVREPSTTKKLSQNRLVCSTSGRRASRLPAFTA